MDDAHDALVNRINALLPQTQCTRCGYPACRPYAEAIARGEANINQCPPGGAAGIKALADLLDRSIVPLDPAFGVEAAPVVAVIDEAHCIGCTLCIQACPVDAIVGSAKRMHTIIASECTGCELCIPPCPVDCISLLTIASEPLVRDNVEQRAALARRRFDARNHRGEQAVARRNLRRAATSASVIPSSLPSSAPLGREAVLAAIARGKARRQALKDKSDP